MPKGVDPEKEEEKAEMSASALKAMMIVQIVLSVFLKGALDDLWGLYFTLQIMCYMSIYDVNFPASANMYVEEFTKIIEFDILEPEGMIGIFVPDFDLRAFVTGTAIAMNKDQEASVIKDLQVYLLLAGFVVIVLIFAAIGYVCFQKYKEKIKAKVTKAIDKFFWNGSTQSLLVSYAQVAMSTAVELKMIMRQSRYLTSSSYMVGAACSIYLVGGMLNMFYHLNKIKHRLDLKETKDHYSEMYKGIYHKNNKIRIFYWPFFLFRRIVFFAIPVLIYKSTTIQLQALCFFTSLYIVVVVHVRPHSDRNNTRLEIVNEIAIMVQCYHMFCFTEFNL